MPNYYADHKTPLGFPNSTIEQGTSLEADLEMWHEKWSPTSDDLESLKSRLTPYEMPAMMCSHEVKQMYVNAEYEKIKSLKEQIKQDVKGVDEKIRDEGEKAFRVIRTADGRRYYVAYDANASVWITCRKPKGKFEEKAGESATAEQTSIVQVGKYSASTGVVGLSHYNFTYPYNNAIDEESCYLVSVIVQIIQSTLKKDISTDHIMQFLVDKIIVFNLEKELNCIERIIQCFCADCCTRFTCFIIMQLLACLLKWNFKQFSVKLAIFNWSTEYSLVVSDHFIDNATMTRNEREINENTYIIKIPEARVETPPEFQPRIPIESICHYNTIFFISDFNFFAGCGFALKFKIDQKQSKGFIYAFDCQRLIDNRQKARKISTSEETAKEYYYSIEDWNKNPRKFSISTEGVPVTFTLNASSCFNNRYFPIINFGYEDQELGPQSVNEE